MALNPAATDFTPDSPTLQAVTTASTTQGYSSIQAAHSKSAVEATNRQLKYGIYRDKRQAIIHTIIREGFTSAQIEASYNDHVSNENVKDKLVVNLVRLLAGLGWSTSIVLRAVAILEMDPGSDALNCLQQARKLGEEYRQRQANSLSGSNTVKDEVAVE